MKIYDSESKRVLEKVTVFLSPEEAIELGSASSDLAKDPQKQHHHIFGADYASEITIAVYTPENLSQFDWESRRVIEGSATR